MGSAYRVEEETGEFVIVSAEGEQLYSFTNRRQAEAEAEILTTLRRRAADGARRASVRRWSRRFPGVDEG